MFFLPETRGHLPVSEKAAKSLSKGVRVQEGERMGGERGAAVPSAEARVLVAVTLTLHGAKGHPAPIGPMGSSASESPFPSCGAGRGWNVLGPMGLAPACAGTHGVGIGTCWNPWPQCWDVLGCAAPVIGYVGTHGCYIGACCVPNCWHWDVLGPVAPVLGCAGIHGLHWRLAGSLVPGTGTY